MVCICYIESKHCKVKINWEIFKYEIKLGIQICLLKSSASVTNSHILSGIK